MILSVSRRTDIPAFYAEWFFRRMKAGYVLVRNPMNFHQVSRIPLTPDVVDGIVFWTKNPLPMMARLGELEGVPYYFQFTLNAYGRDVEPAIPSKNEVLIPAFQELSQRIGRERVRWRYDPILLGGPYTVEYHRRCFERIAQRLYPYTDCCTISFLDEYRETRRRLSALGGHAPSPQEMLELAGPMAETAKRLGFSLQTCAEEMELNHLRISHGRCIDRELLERIGGFRLNAAKDPNQRKACGCAAAADIGAYDTCPAGCLYCYAVHAPNRIRDSRRDCVEDSALLCGSLTPEDRVTERPVCSQREDQLRLF